MQEILLEARQARQHMFLQIAILELKIDNDIISRMNTLITDHSNQDSCQGFMDLDEENPVSSSLEESLTTMSDSEILIFIIDSSVQPV